jgi:ketosteroid isomerase-like protein
MSRANIIDERSAIKAGINAWITAVEGRDIRQLPEVITQDVSAVWVGAGAGDWLVGYEALEQAMQAQNEALDNIHILASNETIHISSAGDMAWATRL